MNNHTAQERAINLCPYSKDTLHKVFGKHCQICKEIEDALLLTRSEALEEAAKVAEQIYGGKSTKCSENSYMYSIQDATCEKIAKSIRNKKLEG